MSHSGDVCTPSSTKVSTFIFVRLDIVRRLDVLLVSFHPKRFTSVVTTNLMSSSRYGFDSDHTRTSVQETRFSQLLQMVTLRPLLIQPLGERSSYKWVPLLKDVCWAVDTTQPLEATDRAIFITRYLYSNKRVSKVF